MITLPRLWVWGLQVVMWVGIALVAWSLWYL